MEEIPLPWKEGDGGVKKRKKGTEELKNNSSVPSVSLMLPQRELGTLSPRDTGRLRGV
jgi:hypothetical protein